jgi:hypothetical protein
VLACERDPEREFDSEAKRLPPAKEAQQSTKAESMACDGMDLGQLAPLHQSTLRRECRRV